MTTLTRRLARLLDPAGGDSITHPYRRLRLNLRRVELVGLLAVLIAAVEGLFSSYRQAGPYLWACTFMGGGAVIAIALAFLGQRRMPEAFRYLPEGFVIFALMASQLLCYFITQSGRVASGYFLVYLACAVFFLIPPRRFAIIGFVTFAIFVAWIVASPLTGFEKTNNIFNAALAVGAGMIGRWGLDRLEKTDAAQKRRIAEQNATLVAMNQKLQRNNEELNGLMAVAAHDLRSPLFGLGNLLDLASQRPPSNAEGWQDVLRAAGHSISSMQVLISRILEAHEAEWASEDLLAPVDLACVLDGARQRNAASALRAGIRLRVEGAGVSAMADAARLEQVVDNLVSNAIRFSPPGSDVVLRVGLGERPFIAVEDRGTGIPEAEREMLFGKFKRGANRPVNGAWGSGLGLYIARTLALRMGAMLDHAPREGGGSVFRITFSPRLPQ